VAGYNVDENLTPGSIDSNAYLFDVSLAGLGIGFGLESTGPWS